MDYLNWNNVIASFFFNENMSDEEIHLYITKDDVIEIGKNYINDKTNDEIWIDYINALREGYVNKVDDTNFLTTLELIYSYYKRENTTNPTKFPYPLYIGYLCATIIPLTLEDTESFSANNYYSPVNKFLSTNKLPPLRNLSQYENWNYIWEDLMNWSIIEKDMALGYFEIHDFGHPGWKFVSKPLSQCIFRIGSLRKIPELFYHENILPNQNIQDEKFRTFLLNNQEKLDLKKYIITSLIRENTLGLLVIKIVRRYYEKWKGEELYYLKSDVKHGLKKPWTLASIKLVLSINVIQERLSFSFRIFSKNEYPENLFFNGSLKVEYELNNWSKQIHISPDRYLSNGLNLSLVDEYNRWKAIFYHRNIIFFKSGNFYSLPGWIETDTITELEEVLILCNEEGFQEIIYILDEDVDSYLRALDYEGLNNLHLFKVIKSLPQTFLEIFEIVLSDEIALTFNNILQVQKCDYLIDCKPSITISNLGTNESIFINYKGFNERVKLERTEEGTSIFKIPAGIKEDVNIELLKSNSEQSTLSSFKFIKRYINSNYLEQIPIRNSFAEFTENEQDYLWKGNKLLISIEASSLYSQSIHHFKPECDRSMHNLLRIELRNQPIYNEVKDVMLGFLSCLGRVSFDKYFTTFEQIAVTHKNIEKIQNVNYSKYLSIRYLESLGHIDVDYVNQKIYVNEPQIILIPNRIFKGRQALLIGARDTELVKNIIKESHELKIKVKIDNSIHSDTGFDYIIPQTIRLFVQGSEDDNYGEDKIINLCNKLNIFFSPLLLQPTLLISSSKIADYEKQLVIDEGEDYEWARQIFNAENLRFEISTMEFDKNLSLLRYHFTNYHNRFRLWMDGKCFTDKNIRNEGIDPLWGRYFILYKFQKDILLFDNDSNLLAVPATVPLPRFFNKALTLMSGFIPYQKTINGITYDVYGNLIRPLMINILTQLGQNVINRNLN